MLNFRPMPIDLTTIDGVKLTKTLERTIGQIWRQAIREWVKALLISGVPVETGMAKAALQPIGRFISNVNVAGGIAISPIREPYYSKLEGGIQSIQLGQDKTYYDIEDDKTHPGRMIFTYEWYTEIQHFWLSQFYKGSYTAGEVAMEAASEAFHEYISDALDRRLTEHLADLIKGSR